MKPLRILYFQPAASFGGAERQAAQAIRLLPSFGVEVLPVVGPGRAIVDFLEDAGIHRYLLRRDLPDDPKAPRNAIARVQLGATYARAYFRLIRDLDDEARAWRSDLLYASRPFAWVVSGVVGARLGLPVVWRAGTAFEHWSQPAVLRWFARARPPRAVVYTSSSVLRTIATAVPAPSFVLHNGVDTDRFAPRGNGGGDDDGGDARASLGRQLGLGANAKVVAWVARIAPEKGLAMLVEVCARLRDLAPSAVVVVAGDSGWRAHLEARVRAAGLGDRLRFLGFVRDIERVYAAADVVVSTSAAEGCPNALLEAMAMGRAVVATRVGGTAELLRDGRDGVLVAPGDAETFARAVAALCAAPSRRATLGRSAARHVVQHFSLRAQVGRLAEILYWSAGRTPPHKEGAAEPMGLSARPPRRWASRPLAEAPCEAPSTAASGPAQAEVACVAPGADAAKVGERR